MQADDVHVHTARAHTRTHTHAYTRKHAHAHTQDATHHLHLAWCNSYQVSHSCKNCDYPLTLTLLRGTVCPRFNATIVSVVRK